MRKAAQASTALDKYLFRIGQNLTEALDLTMTALERYTVYDLLEQRREE